MAKVIKVSLYRYDHSDGSSKDWAVVEPAPGDAVLSLYHGRTGRALRLLTIPPASWRQATAAAEALARAEAKQVQGYRSLGSYAIDTVSHQVVGPVPDTLLASLSVATPPESPADPTARTTRALLTAVKTEQADWFF